MRTFFREAAVLALLSVCASGLKAAEIEFAESVPEGTVYGSTLASRPAALWSDMIAGAGKTLDIEE
ncbi:MAG TPA: hypothetical protein PL037_02280, partial [Elusimicrobiales bacterium]|nr:hypothetical protein [Elusimicrobiales bacterium]